MAREKIDVLVLTVPAEAAQKVLDIAAASGTLKGVLNFSPSPSLSDGVLSAPSTYRWSSRSCFSSETQGRK